MRHESYQFIQTGAWDRQPELLREARMLHRAKQAVREATAIARSGSAANAADLTRLANAWRLQGVARASRPALSWRTAAARMGTSLVTFGRRLECLGGVGQC